MVSKIYTDETVNKCKRCIKMHNFDGFIWLSEINRRLANTSIFINHVHGSARAIRNAVKALVEDGFIVEVKEGIFKLTKD